MKTKKNIQLYNDLIMDHFKNPRHSGTINKPDFSVHEVEETCGDVVSYQGLVKNDILSDVAFTSEGCMISQAAASLLSDAVINTSLENIMAMDKDDMLRLLQLELGPNRQRCAQLPLRALQKGITLYRKNGDA